MYELRKRSVEIHPLYDETSNRLTYTKSSGSSKWKKKKKIINQVNKLFTKYPLNVSVLIEGQDRHREFSL